MEGPFSSSIDSPATHAEHASTRVDTADQKFPLLSSVFRGGGGGGGGGGASVSVYDVLASTPSSSRRPLCSPRSRRSTGVSLLTSTTFTATAVAAEAFTSSSTLLYFRASDFTTVTYRRTT